MQVISTQTAPHYKWAELCDGWRLVQADAFSVIQERMPPNTSEVAHFHNLSRQFFFLLSGSLSIEIDGSLHKLGPQQGFEIAPKLSHRVFNDSAGDACFLVISVPPSQADRVLI
jgi:mannose-6-phosphate isomerase-like protein (cupin superfamily)